MRVYVWTDGREFNMLPNIIDNTSPITEAWWLSHGGRIEDRADPEPEPEPEPVVRYSKYKLKLACESRSLWTQVKDLIERSGKWESFLLINDIASDNQELMDVMPTIRKTFGSDVVDKVLAESIAD